MLQYSRHQLDQLFQALGDATRREMVERLCRGPVSVSELAEPFDMTLSAVVQHLRILEACGLVRSEKEGRVRVCRIDPKALRCVESWFAERRSKCERIPDRSGESLAVEDTKTRRRKAGARDMRT